MPRRDDRDGDDWQDRMARWAALFQQSWEAVREQLLAMAAHDPAQGAYAADDVDGRCRLALARATIMHFPILWIAETWGRGGASRAGVECLMLVAQMRQRAQQAAASGAWPPHQTSRDWMNASI